MGFTRPVKKFWNRLTERLDYRRAEWPRRATWAVFSAAVASAGCHCWLVEQCFPRLLLQAWPPNDDPPGSESSTYDEPGHIHELTFSCFGRLPLLTNDVWRGMSSESIDRALDCHSYRLVAFVFMPEHVHLLVDPLSTSSQVAELLKAIKRPFAWRIKRLLVEAQSPLVERLTVQQRPGVTAFRFWQEGPGYDRNLTEPKAVLAAIDYVHCNRVRRGLVARAADWRWSSAPQYNDPTGPKDASLPTVSGMRAEWLNR